MYRICLSFNLNVKDFRQEIIDKTRFMIETYKKYQENIVKKIKLLPSETFFQWGAEKEFLLEEIEEKQFNISVKQLQTFLKEIAKEFA